MVVRIILLLLLAVPVRSQVIGPLLQTEWHQNEPYNGLCPEIKGERAIVGCVATALTEIMYTYQWPAATCGTLQGWSTEQYTLDDIVSGTPIDWPNILVDYRGQYSDRQAEAVARLSLMAGMACHMNYGTGSSGADTYRYLETLQPAFGFPYVHMYDRVYHSPQTWRAILKYELSQGHPLLYTGYNQLFNGHAFVIDGYDARTGLFHAGWGYGGAYNGWFDIDVLNPFEPYYDATSWGRREGFFCNQSALAFAPVECQPFEADSLLIDVTLDSISVPQLCLGRTREAVFHFTNNTADTLTYTYEVLSNAATDTALFEQADYVGISAVKLLPYSNASDTVLLRIKKAGERQLRISHDDVKLSEPVCVRIDSVDASRCTIGDIEVLAVGEDYITVTAPIDGAAVVTWCLFPDESLTVDTDVRHWSLGQDTITFTRLQPAHTYALVVREPWTVRQKLVFTTAITPVNAPKRDGDGGHEYYDLQGRRHTARPNTPIYIHNGRKIAK